MHGRNVNTHVQWNLSITATIGNSISGRIVEVDCASESTKVMCIFN